MRALTGWRGDIVAVRFYACWGFQDLPFDPRSAMLVRMIDLQRSWAETER